MHFGIFFLEIMHVVGGYNLDAYLVGELYEKGQNSPLLGYAVVLNFNIEIFAEYVLKVERHLPCALVIAV